MDLYDLKTNHMTSPVIDGRPEFSWRIASDQRDVMQASWRIRVRECGQAGRLVWDSEVVGSDQQAFVPYGGPELASRTVYEWQVDVEDSHGEVASATARFETGLLAAGDWVARWIECPFVRPDASEYRFGAAHPAVIFRKRVTIDKPVAAARLYATAYGAYRLTVNGQRPDDRELAPEFTPYDRVLYYQAYDVAGLLHPGANTLEMLVGDGWYFSAQAGPVMAHRHDEPACLAQLHVTFSDGTSACFATDGSETCELSQIVYSDLYQGERQDLTLGPQPAQAVRPRDYGYANLCAQPMDPIVPARLVPATNVFRSPKGEVIVDFGQVMCGRARVRIDVPAGRVVTLEYFEELSDEGDYINTMFAPQRDTVVSDGRPFLHEAVFTFHGFRYIRVSGMEARREDFTAVLLTTRKEDRGSLLTSEARLNRLYQNVRWSQWSNTMSVPTDCPSREKAGYTGDLLVYARTALMNEDMTPFLRSWLRSVRADQAADGTVMIVSPWMNLYDGLLRKVCRGFGDEQITGVAGWSDAIVWVPYQMYQVTGNAGILAENYEAMERWAGYVIRTAAERRGDRRIPERYDRLLWNTGFHFGEWLIPSQPAGTPTDPYAQCPKSSCYTAPFFGYETVLRLAEISAVLGRNDRAAYYAGVADQMREAIQEGILRAGLLPRDLMGAYVLAFAFGLVPDDLRDEYHQQLVDLVHAHGDRLDTGFLATPFLLDVLCDLGEKDLAYRVFWQDRRPGWLYEVDHGATTIWEAWDADDARGGGRFVSFDHYAFGCVDDFVCRRMAGLDFMGAGGRRLRISPDPGCGLVSCRRTFLSEAGLVCVNWDQDHLRVTIPCNATAEVEWRGEHYSVGSGSYEW